MKHFSSALAALFLVSAGAAQAADLTAIRSAIQNGDCNQAVTALNSAISAGDADAMNQLASMHLVGTCVAHDQAQAIALYEKAAAAGSSRAKAMLERARKNG